MKDMENNGQHHSEGAEPYAVSMLLVACQLLVLGVCCSATGTPPETGTSQGRLRGQLATSRSGREYLAFTGVPYGRPPVGPLRLKPPLPVGEWKGVLDATKPSPLCFQWHSSNDVRGKEDCLYLNVYTPRLNGSLPVMFYLHGGGFAIGYSGDLNTGKYFMDEDVVLVTPNYRLGRLGFMSFENDVIPGNMGLKDQALALKWVKREIAAFGGNPELVTAFGHSAGSVAAHYLCSIPKTSGLLKGCISHSGVAGTTWTMAKRGTARAAAVAVAEALGCAGDQALACLQAKPVELLTNETLISQDIRPAPVVEPLMEDALITSWPSGIKNFPWITGTTADEGMLFTGYYEYVRRSYDLNMFITYFQKSVLESLLLDNKNDGKKIVEKYFKSADPLKAARKLGTDAFFLYPALNALSTHTGPKYFYIFNYTGGPSWIEIRERRNLNVTGVSHHDDYPYFFKREYKYIPPGWPKDNDVKLSQTLIRMWVNFARHQTPNTIGDGTPDWPMFDNATYLHIANDGIKAQRSSHFVELLDFWRNII